MAKSLLFNDHSRKALEVGVEKLSKAVSITLGPKGRNVVLERKFTTPLITNDGVTIAKEIELENPAENLGASILKEVSIKTNEVAGDGTTTAVVLASSLIKSGLKNLTAGANPIQMRKGMQLACNRIVERLQEISQPIRSEKEIAQVASISAGDKEIGELVAKAMKKIGNDSTITLEESKTMNTTLSIVEGMQFDRGYISSHMVTNQEKNTAILENPYILITDKIIRNIQDLLPLMEEIARESSSLLIIAEDVEGEALATILLNKIRGLFNCVAIKAPSFGDRRKAELEDISIFVGATLISADLGLDLNNTEKSMLGKAKRVIVDKEKTIIIGGNGDPNKIKDRINSLKFSIGENLNAFDNEILQERISKLTGGVGVISVGAATEIELQEKKLRLEDALSSTKAAHTEGIVPGGGVALLRCISALDSVIEGLTGDEKTGAKIVLDSLYAPIKQILNNSGLDASVIISQILEKDDISYGYDAYQDRFGNMYDFGIIDPTKVTRSCLQNAVSVASTLLTTECLVYDTIKQENDNPPNPF